MSIHNGLSSLARVLFFGSFVLIALFLTLFFGYHQTDHEFINALAYRVSEGDFPYRDFEYVRPPLSLYLHSLTFNLFPDNAILVSRLVYFLEMCMISFLTTRMLVAVNLLKKEHQHLWVAVFLLLSLHNFPAMPWHTVDGLLFSSLALFLLMRGIREESRFHLVLAGVFCGLAALTKQNFLLISPLFLMASFLICRFRFLFVLLGQLVCGFLFFVYLSQNDLLVAYSQSTSEDSSIVAIVKSVISQMTITKTVVILPSLIILAFFVCLKNTTVVTLKLAIVLAVSSIVLLGILELYIGRWGTYANPKVIYQLVWVFSIYFFLTEKSSLRDFFRFDSIVLVLMFCIGFSSMISWGYPFPSLYCAPYFAILIYAFEKRVGKINPELFLILVFSSWLLVSNIQYRDSYKLASTNNLGDLYPKLNSIHVGDENFATYKDLKDLTSGYSIASVVPDFPLFAYLNDQRPEFKVDWYLDPETSSSPEEYLAGMDGKYFVIMNSCFLDANQPKRIALCRLIEENSQLIKQINNLNLYYFDRNSFGDP